jgi:hypothetical protein
MRYSARNDTLPICYPEPFGQYAQDKIGEEWAK